MKLFNVPMWKAPAHFNYAFLKVDQDGHVLYLTLDRADKKNALHPVMVNELAYTLRWAHQEKSVWAVVLRANGDTFCAGADLKAFLGEAEPASSTVPLASEEILIAELFHGLHKPCIAQVEGDVYAGGFLLLCGCTHVIAREGTRFGLPEARRGLWPFQVMASLLELMPARIVLDWCMRGDVVDAATALERGLLSQIVPEGQTGHAVAELLKVLLANSPGAIRRGLEAYQHLRGEDAREQQAYLLQKLMETVKSADAREGIQAFKEKRRPVWTGQ